MKTTLISFFLLCSSSAFAANQSPAEVIVEKLKEFAVKHGRSVIQKDAGRCKLWVEQRVRSNPEVTRLPLKLILEGEFNRESGLLGQTGLKNSSLFLEDSSGNKMETPSELNELMVDIETTLKARTSLVNNDKNIFQDGFEEYFHKTYVIDGSVKIPNNVISPLLRALGGLNVPEASLSENFKTVPCLLARTEQEIEALKAKKLSEHPEQKNPIVAKHYIGQCPRTLELRNNSNGLRQFDFAEIKYSRKDFDRLKYKVNFACEHVSHEVSETNVVTQALDILKAQIRAEVLSELEAETATTSQVENEMIDINQISSLITEENVKALMLTLPQEKKDILKESLK